MYYNITPPINSVSETSLKIALVRPWFESVLVTPPLGIGYLSSFLKNSGYSVLLIDALRDNLREPDISKILKDSHIDVLGITCVSSFYNEVVKMSLYMKKYMSSLKVIIGGVHPTFLPYQTLVDSKCDYVVCGEGEKALKELLDNDFENRNIRGIYSLKELKSENDPFVKAEAVMNLDELPYPDWEQMKPSAYPNAAHGVFLKGYPVGIVTSSRGCSYSCKFCASPNFYEHKIRFRSAENVVGEIMLLKEKYHVKEIHFEDDNLTMNREHVVQICNLLIKNDIKVHWSCPNGIRADRIDNELVILMKKSGFYSCSLGIESIDEQILKNINKKEEPSIIENAIYILRKNKIEVCGFFILGLPGETEETIKKTIDFSLRSGLTRANFNILYVMPGCDLFKELEGKFIHDFSNDIDICRKPNYLPDGLTIENLVNASKIAFKKFYLRPSILLNCLRFIKFSYIKETLFKRLRLHNILKKE